MSAPFPNLYTHRRVAESAAKACDICYKPSTSVLITPDRKDFFYVCPVHLKDKYFCAPKVDVDAAKARREKALAEETEKLKKEYEERQRQKKDKDDKGKDKGQDKDKGNEKEKGAEAGEKGDGKGEAKGASEASATSSAAVMGQPSGSGQTTKDEPATAGDEEPRIFELKSAFYQQRLQKKRQLEAAKRDRERVSQPNYFPSVPSRLPGK